MDNTKNEAVVLLHGLGLSAFFMKRIEFNLEERGFDVFNIDYDSRKQAIQTSVEQIADELDALKLNRYDKVHFVGHSLGSIIMRDLLSRECISNVGIAIALAPPNHGSILADRLCAFKLYRWYFGKAGLQLGVGSEYLRSLKFVPEVYYVIAGDKSSGTIFGRWFDELSDGTVSLKSTELEGMDKSRHFVYPVTHLGILYNEKVVKKLVDILGGVDKW